VLAVLAAIAVPLYLQQRTKAKQAATRQSVHLIQNAIVTYAADNGGEYPSTEYVAFTPADKLADNLGNRYLDRWPTNAWTGQPVANTGSGVLFDSDFASITAQKPLVGAKWTVVDGVLVPPAPGGSVAFGDSAWTDVQLDVTAKLDSGGYYGVYFRADGKPKISGYCFQYDPGLGNKFVVRKWVNGVESAPIAMASMPSGFSIYGTPHTTRISAVGDHIVVKVDGQSVLDFKDDTFAAGAAGLKAGAKTSISFFGATAAPGGSGGSSPSQGDFAYAYDPSKNTTYGLVGWLSAGTAFVIQPLQ
jgi:type II secretory pathway pseudopilin PulG